MPDYLYAYRSPEGVYFAVEVFPELRETGHAIFAKSPSELAQSVAASAWNPESGIFTHEDEELAEALRAWLPNVRTGRPGVYHADPLPSLTAYVTDDRECDCCGLELGAYVEMPDENGRPVKVCIRCANRAEVSDG